MTRFVQVSFPPAVPTDRIVAVVAAPGRILQPAGAGDQARRAELPAGRPGKT
ncbi:hypothetical protein [Actinoplanes subtropicus]|uniref:hypothetical protein n=1 Tax=Actinoplanes subtropicus TaxID=543632 RepID=UPI000A5DCDCD|nr:hypothetical protein [Actinoplanes subtropicus]